MLKAASSEEIISKCRAHQIGKMITISTSPDNLDEVIKMADRFDDLYCTQGLHPHDGKEWNETVRAHILENLNHETKKKK